MDAYAALIRFLQRGIGFSAGRSADEIIDLAGSLRETLEAMLAGRDLFTFQRPANFNQ